MKWEVSDFLLAIENGGWIYGSRSKYITFELAPKQEGPGQRPCFSFKV
jgi:hypothetical protein